MDYDITGAQIKVGSWVAYATGSGELKIGRVIRAKEMSIYGKTVIQNVNINKRKYTTDLFPKCVVVIPECRVPKEVKSRF